MPTAMLTLLSTRYQGPSLPPPLPWQFTTQTLWNGRHAFFTRDLGKGKSFALLLDGSINLEDGKYKRIGNKVTGRKVRAEFGVEWEPVCVHLDDARGIVPGTARFSIYTSYERGGRVLWSLYSNLLRLSQRLTTFSIGHEVKSRSSLFRSSCLALYSASQHSYKRFRCSSHFPGEYVLR